MPRRHRPVHRRRRAAALALTAIGTLLTFGAPAGPASAAPAVPGPSTITAAPRAGAAPIALTPARPASLVRSAQAAVGITAR